MPTIRGGWLKSLYRRSMALAMCGLCLGAEKQELCIIILSIHLEWIHQ